MGTHRTTTTRWGVSRRRLAAAALLIAGLAGATVMSTSAVLTNPAQVASGQVRTGFTNLDANLTARQVPITYSVPALTPGASRVEQFTIRNTDRMPLWYSATSTVTGTPAIQMAIRVGVATCSEAGFTQTGTALYGPAVLGSSTGARLFGDSTYGRQTGDRDLATGAEETLCIRTSLPGTSTATSATTASLLFTQEQTAGGTYVPAVKALGPLLYYRLNDPDNSARDVAYGRSGAYGGTVSHRVTPVPITSDSSAGYVRLDGTPPGYVDLPNIAASEFANGLSISAWVYPVGYNLWDRIVEFGNGPEKSNILFGLNDQATGVLRYSDRGPNGGAGIELWSPQKSVPLNTWTHVAVTVSKANVVTLYVNGKPVATGTSSNSVTTAVARTVNYIGRPSWTNDDYLDGAISEVGIWNRPLTDSDIAGLYAAR
jgi:hypothetical protein